MILQLMYFIIRELLGMPETRSQVLLRMHILTTALSNKLCTERSSNCFIVFLLYIFCEPYMPTSVEEHQKSLL